ncbi:CapA family protein [Streptococcus hyovaginalis]|uniref:CapA family protein n=1 Tax=Streptococcus hyovaginalis TaxID=149015 RepID=UPI002A917033|nr:CapA family protein [Streptococcus hyovaginalis]MDY5973904.1 CapA family protein [Streptococcus hyovaginalis]
MKRLGMTKKLCLAFIALSLLVAGLYDGYQALTSDSVTVEGKAKTARIVANGDILLHDVLYASALKEDGTYDFEPYFTYVKDRISSADLAIGDYEGTISPDHPLSGYPLFNAPPSIATALKNTGYDVMDLAHNHILDSGLEGALNTKKTFNDLGIDTIGLYDKDRSKDGFLIKDVNGIKIAILGYSYGYNGMEANLTEEEYDKHLSDLDETKIKAELKKAEKSADLTIVMPQMGVEYQLEPTKEQEQLYRQMVKWGADLVLGGHPHVVEPAEIIEQNGEKKAIIYSMGNFISNQRLEMMGDKWPERGVLMDVTIEKKGGKTTLKTVQAHPTLVDAKPTGELAPEGYNLYDYRVMVLEDFIQGGKYRDAIDDGLKAKVDLAYQEMNDHVNLEW